MATASHGKPYSRLRNTMHWLTLGDVRMLPNDHAPATFKSVIEAIAQSAWPESAVREQIRAMGFDSFMYGASTSPQPGQDSQIFTFTTLPREWVVKYDREAYIEVDPRVQHWFESSLPYIWDQLTLRGRSLRLDRFLDAAGRYGIRSGVSFRIPDYQNWSVITCFNSELTDVQDSRRSVISRNLGELMTFSCYFHEEVMRPKMEKGLSPQSEGVALSPRERECLAYAAKGYTTEQIARQIGVRPRTAQFHFDSIRTKLAVVNRQQALVKAIQLGLLDHRLEA